MDIVAPARPEFGGAVETDAADLTAPRAAEFDVATQIDSIASGEYGVVFIRCTLRRRSDIDEVAAAKYR